MTLLLSLWIATNLAVALWEWSFKRPVEYDILRMWSYPARLSKHLRKRGLKFLARHTQMRSAVKTVLMLSFSVLMVGLFLIVLVAISEEVRTLQEKVCRL